MTQKNIYALGETPPERVVPRLMHASVIRHERYGQPLAAFRRERIPVPRPNSKQVLVWVMAAGVNYNNVWAALGRPIDVIERRLQKGANEAYHIGGSDAAGIVWATGDQVSGVQPGDHVVLSCGMWDESSPDIQAGADPIMSASARIWGFEENWGSFAQFTLVDDYQCHPKPSHLSWAEAAAYMLVGATAWRMLHGWPPNTIQKGQPVLIWGGAGGLGSMALQIVREAGGLPVAVVSDTAKFEICAKLGARGVIDRTRFEHWGRLPDLNDTAAFKSWLKEVRAFAAEFHRVLGNDCSPKIVFEHPGTATLPTSIFICASGGMVVTCAGTSGYNADVDLRYLWMRQKRFQGSHFANTNQCRQLNEMICSKRIEPALSKVFTFDQVGECHQMMFENRHPPGNMAILVNARDRDEGRSS